MPYVHVGTDTGITRIPVLTEISLSNIVQTRHDVKARVFIIAQLFLKALHSFFFSHLMIVHTSQSRETPSRKTQKEKHSKITHHIFHTFQTLPISSESPTSPVFLHLLYSQFFHTSSLDLFGLLVRLMTNVSHWIRKHQPATWIDVWVSLDFSTLGEASVSIWM